MSVRLVHRGGGQAAVAEAATPAVLLLLGEVIPPPIPRFMVVLREMELGSTTPLVGAGCCIQVNNPRHDTTDASVSGGGGGDSMGGGGNSRDAAVAPACGSCSRVLDVKRSLGEQVLAAAVPAVG